MLTLGDGGAIYTSSDCSYITIQNNIISDVIGCSEATPLWGGTYSSWSSANGIYLDAGGGNNVVKDNTIIRAQSMALMSNYNTRNNTIRNNTCYDCASNDGGYYIFVGINTATNDGGHVITKNIFLSTNGKTNISQFKDFSSALHSPGVLDSNYYLNPHGGPISFETLLNNSGTWVTSRYTYAGWQNLTGQEAHSKYIIPASYKRDTLFVNSTASPVTVSLPPVLFQDCGRAIDQLTGATARRP